MSSSPTIVVFDIGNVLLDWDMRRVYHRLFDDEAAMERFFAETNLIDWNIEQDRGREWRQAENLLIAEFPHYETEILAFRRQWHDMISGPIAKTVALHQALWRQSVPLYAITNFAADTFRESRQRYPFLQQFIDVVVSAEEKLLKPQPEIYQCLLTRNNLKAADCLFIDDSKANIAGAKAIGMAGHHFVSANHLAIDLQHHGFKI